MDVESPFDDDEKLDDLHNYIIGANGRTNLSLFKKGNRF